MVLNSWDQVMDELFVNQFQRSYDCRIDGKNDKLNTSTFFQQQNPTLNNVSKFAELNLNSSTDLENFSLKRIKKKATNRVEKEVITYILEKTAWNKSTASKILKISYKTLLNKIDELKISSH